MTDSKTMGGLAEQFNYLDQLRDSGRTNMFAASPYLEQRFEMSIADARNVLSQWMKTYDGETTALARATNALSLRVDGSAK
jgi:hypothetical protein